MGTNARALHILTVERRLWREQQQQQRHRNLGGGGGTGAQGLPSLPKAASWHDHHLGSVYATAWTYADASGSVGLLATASNDTTLHVARWNRDPALGTPDTATTSAASASTVVLQPGAGTLRDCCWLGAGAHAGVLPAPAAGYSYSHGPPTIACAGGGDFAIRLWDIQAAGRGSNSSSGVAAGPPLRALVGHTGVVHSLRPWGTTGVVSASAGACKAVVIVRV